MNSHFKIISAVAAAVLAALLPLSAETIIEDKFSSMGPLNGTSPPVTPDGTVWQTGGKEGAIMSDGEGARVRLLQPLSALLEVGLSAPGRYALSMEVVFPALSEQGRESWVALGFSEGKKARRAFNAGDEAAGSPWILLRWGGSAQVFAGKGVARPLGKPTEERYMQEEKHLLTLIVDTRDESWTLEASIDNEPLMIGRGGSEVYTFTKNPVLRYVGFSSYALDAAYESGEAPEAVIRSFRLERETEK